MVSKSAPTQSRYQLFEASEWHLLEPLLAKRNHLGRPLKWPRRLVANAVFYLLRTGCQWRMLPRCFPPWPTVHSQFRRWRMDGGRSGRRTTTCGDTCARPRVTRLAAERGWRLEVARHPDHQLWRYGLEPKPKNTFRVLPRRWVAERTFAWLGQSRRLTRDYEHLPDTAEAMIFGAMTRLMLRRVARDAP